MATGNLAEHEAALDPHSQYMTDDVLQQLGDIIVAAAASLPTALHVENPGDVLFITLDTPHKPAWTYIGIIAVPRALFTTKGSLVVGTGNGQFAELVPGSAGAYLTPDPTSPFGLKWTTLPTVCPYELDFSFDCDSGYLAVL